MYIFWHKNHAVLHLVLYAVRNFNFATKSEILHKGNHTDNSLNYGKVLTFFKTSFFHQKHTA